MGKLALPKSHLANRYNVVSSASIARRPPNPASYSIEALHNPHRHAAETAGIPGVYVEHHYALALPGKSQMTIMGDEHTLDQWVILSDSKIRCVHVKLS